jgi:hypothetical protein
VCKRDGLVRVLSNWSRSPVYAAGLKGNRSRVSPMRADMGLRRGGMGDAVPETNPQPWRPYETAVLRVCWELFRSTTPPSGIEYPCSLALGDACYMGP